MEDKIGKNKQEGKLMDARELIKILDRQTEVYKESSRIMLGNEKSLVTDWIPGNEAEQAGHYYVTVKGDTGDYVYIIEFYTDYEWERFGNRIIAHCPVVLKEPYKGKK